jgi:hypothetical protein
MKQRCQHCGEEFDPENDPYHRENCAEANRP